MSDNKTKKCNFKCNTREHYDNFADYCREKKIKDCSKQVHTDFSQCEDFLIREKLVMF